MNTDTRPQMLPPPDVSARRNLLEDELEKLERLEELERLFFSAKRQHHYQPKAPLPTH